MVTVPRFLLLVPRKWFHASDVLARLLVSGNPELSGGLQSGSQRSWFHHFHFQNRANGLYFVCAWDRCDLGRPSDLWQFLMQVNYVSVIIWWIDIYIRQHEKRHKLNALDCILSQPSFRAGVTSQRFSIVRTAWQFGMRHLKGRRIQGNAEPTVDQFGSPW